MYPPFLSGWRIQWRSIQVVYGLISLHYITTPRVTALLSLLNGTAVAAHGKFEEYSDDQVRDMLQGVRHFMARTTEF
jgi:hypothetical protein